ncbi:M24 family metallopeptidase [Burkholderia cenocepacia]|uniref:M24 family metallopeptidase n=1 Tax=Burkholderia cenocepacia TaxID=95486 RepID=UPI001639F694|nr:M24 family metallopeptidase [Burkholderia cenocepacia]
MATKPHAYRRFSLAERDRRWHAVRQLMRRDDLAALIAPPNPGNSTDWQADARYLSHCGGGADTSIGVVFPLDGDVTVVAASAKERWGPLIQDWVSDVRTVNRQFGAAMGERLRELGLDGQRIGVSGLKGGTRTPEGTIMHGTFRALTEALPGAEFVDASELMQDVREVKSDEEIAVLQRSIDIVECALNAQLRAAQPGVPDYVVWAETMHEMFRRGSELSVHFNWLSGANPGRTLTRPTARPLERGDLILGEIEASVLGYRAQRLPVVAVNSCAPIIRDLSIAHGALYESLLRIMRAGVTVREMIEATVAIAHKIAPQRGPLAGLRASLILHGRGLGDDRPLVLTKLDGIPFYDATTRALDARLADNGVYILKPAVATADGAFEFAWGDTVRVTREGALRMGKMPHGLQISLPGSFSDWPTDITVYS